MRKHTHWLHTLTFIEHAAKAKKDKSHMERLPLYERSEFVFSINVFDRWIPVGLLIVSFCSVLYSRLYALKLICDGRKIDHMDVNQMTVTCMKANRDDWSNDDVQWHYGWSNDVTEVFK
eukprot:NODE_235_length_11996_cov_1.212070.p7 type:complete len:119 gc:universal NODE_235_length_11996_cov_1.212070:2910-3266(+)